MVAQIEAPTPTVEAMQEIPASQLSITAPRRQQSDASPSTATSRVNEHNLRLASCLLKLNQTHIVHNYLAGLHIEECATYRSFD